MNGWPNEVASLRRHTTSHAVFRAYGFQDRRDDAVLGEIPLHALACGGRGRREPLPRLTIGISVLQSKVQRLSQSGKHARRFAISPCVRVPPYRLYLSLRVDASDSKFNLNFCRSWSPLFVAASANTNASDDP